VSDRAEALSLARQPPWGGRRLRLWGVATLAALLGFYLQTQTPDWLPHTSLAFGTVLAVFFAAMACELVDSSLGMGYGTTLTPLLLLAGFEPLQIVPAVLLSELLTGLAAGLMHHWDGNVDLLGDRRARRTLGLLCALSALGAVAAVWVALSVSKFWLGVFITAIVLAMGLVTLLTWRRQARYRPGGIVAIGLVAAFNKALSGGGYGPLVTAGQVVSGLPARGAVAITSFAESLTCAVGLATYLAVGSRLDVDLVPPLVFGALLSVPLATGLVRRMRETHLRLAVGALTCALGVVSLAKLVG
jgi:uncharacterized membrane protein YfcA